jgi:hypothetical protein
MRNVGASMAECAGGRLGMRSVADRRGPRTNEAHSNGRSTADREVP